MYLCVSCLYVNVCVCKCVSVCMYAFVCACWDRQAKLTGMLVCPTSSAAALASCCANMHVRELFKQFVEWADLFMSMICLSGRAPMCDVVQNLFRWNRATCTIYIAATSIHRPIGLTSAARQLKSLRIQTWRGQRTAIHCKEKNRCGAINPKAAGHVFSSTLT